MQQWQDVSVTLNADDLKTPGEALENQDLAQRFSEAIIDIVNEYKGQGCELVNMQFNAGVVTINFRQLTR